MPSSGCTSARRFYLLLLWQLALTHSHLRLIIGIPELAVPSCEPLTIDTLKLHQDNGPIHIKSKFENVKIYGLSQFRVRAVRIDAEKAKFRLRLWFPELHMESDYHVKGKFLMLPLEGRGTAIGNFCKFSLSFYNGVTSGRRPFAHNIFPLPSLFI